MLHLKLKSWRLEVMINFLGAQVSYMLPLFMWFCFCMQDAITVAVNAGDDASLTAVVPGFSLAVEGGASRGKTVDSSPSKVLPPAISLPCALDPLQPSENKSVHHSLAKY
jgi:hypothetical protein